jgi:parallel beta-helix repeat protein
MKQTSRKADNQRQRLRLADGLVEPTRSPTKRLLNLLLEFSYRMRTALGAGLVILMIEVGMTSASAETFYTAPAGNDNNPGTQLRPLRQIRKALSLVKPGDTVLVNDSDYLGFDMSELNATAGLPITIRALGANANILPTSDRGDNRDTILVTHSSHVVIDGLRSYQANRAAVRVDNSPHVTIRNGVFGNNATWGIFTDFSDDLLLENNECFGSVEQHGIYVSNSGDRPVVRGNRVHDNHSSGIQLNADASQGGDGIITAALIENNVIYNNGTGGGGALNLDGVQDSVVRNNLLFNNHASGIICFQIDGAAGPTGMQILNNTIDMPTDGRWALNFVQSTGKNFARNNILYNRHSFRGGLRFGDDNDLDNTDSDYNILDRVGPDDGDTRFTLAEWQAQGYELHSLSAPLSNLFVNAAAADYHLFAGSLAVDKGQSLGNVPADLDGRVRRFGAAPDIGCYEFAPPRLEIVRLGDGQIQLRFLSGAGMAYRVDASTDLRGWDVLFRFIGSDEPWQFVEAAAKNLNQRFYRIVPGQ